MKLLFDFLPVILFFVAYKLYGIYTATAVIIVATSVQMALFWLKHRRFESLHITTFALVLLLGGATLLLQDETFIKWKPTVVNWLFALLFLGSQFIGEKPLIARMLSGNVTLPATVWLRLNTGWVVFFVVLGVLNLLVAYNFDTDTWVNFKLFGMMGLTLAFIVAQGFYLAPYVKAGNNSGSES